MKRRKNLIVAPTIKANAYGLGDKEIFKILANNNCKHFFVATVEEGILINNKDKKISIYVLNGVQDYDLNLFINVLALAISFFILEIFEVSEF